MKKCPFCAEEIQDEAIKCKHCSEFLNGAVNPLQTGEKIPWYFSTSFIVIAILCIGPFALPLLWWRPKTHWGWKVGHSVLTIVLSLLLVKVTIYFVYALIEQYKLILSL